LGMSTRVICEGDGMVVWYLAYKMFVAPSDIYRHTL
jgi:hypothetical protein